MDLSTNLQSVQYGSTLWIECRNFALNHLQHNLAGDLPKGPFFGCLPIFKVDFLRNSVSKKVPSACYYSILIYWLWFCWGSETDSGWWKFHLCCINSRYFAKKSVSLVNEEKFPKKEQKNGVILLNESSMFGIFYWINLYLDGTSVNRRYILRLRLHNDFKKSTRPK